MTNNETSASSLVPALYRNEGAATKPTTKPTKVIKNGKDKKKLSKKQTSLIVTKRDNYVRLFLAKFNRSTIILASVLLLAIITAIVAFFLYLQSSNQLKEINAEAESNAQLISDQQAQNERLNQQVNALEQAGGLEKNLASSRSTFNTALSASRETLRSAEGKIDTSASETVLDDAEKAVNAEGIKVADITAQLNIVQAETKKITEAVAAFEAEQKKINDEAANARATELQKIQSAAVSASKPGSGNSSSTAAEQALDELSNNSAILSVQDGAPCPANTPAACVKPDAYNTVVVPRSAVDALGNNVDAWKQIVAAPYAQTVLYRNWVAYQNSGIYTELFQSNLLWTSDCMARQKIGGNYQGYGYGCSADQITAGGNAWNNRF